MIERVEVRECPLTGGKQAMSSDVIGSRIKKLRIESGETQKKLGKAVGVTQVEICRYENQIRLPNIRAVIAIAKHYNVSADYILAMDLVREGEKE